MMKKYLGFVAVSAFLFSCAEIERDNQYDMRAGDNYIPKEGSSSSVVSSSSSVEPSSSSALPSSSSEPLPSSSSEAESSSSTAPSSSSVELSSSSALQSSSSVAQSSSSSVSCTANNNTSTHYCSEGTMKAYGSVTDNDGKTYKTVKIGTQTWMAENLNYNASGSRCYGDNTGGDSQNRCGTYGRLYNWATAMGINASFNENEWGGSDVKHKGICSSGWHIPSDAEWEVLMTAVGGSGTAGTKLKATSGWYNNGNGTDDYGFSALPGGYGYSNGNFSNVGDIVGWWSATEEEGSNYAYIRYTFYSYANVERGHGKSYLYSVRCVQD
jgi:uncharacterized protein (TIGR02145 family)